MTILSILIPTIPERDDMLYLLKFELMEQILRLNRDHPTLGTVQVLIDDRPKFLEGGPSIGKKRESLVMKAQGKYLCFLDDDESISPNYVETLVRLCHQDKDVVTFRNISKLGNYWSVIDMSLAHEENEQATPDRIVKRKPWHICPVRTLFAKLHPFPDSNYGEDWAWFEKVLGHCQTEAKTDAILHQYNHGSHSEADKIVKHETDISKVS